MMEKNQPSPPPPFVSCGKMKEAILKGVSKGLNVRQISKDVGRHRSTVQQHLRELANKKLVYKSGYFWLISDLGKKYLGGLVGVAMSDDRGLVATGWLRNTRAHNIKIKFEVTGFPSDNSWLVGWRSNTKLKNNVFYSSRFGEVVTTYTGRSMIFQLPPMVFDDPDIAVAEAGRIAMILKDKYEGEVFGLKLGSRDISAQLISQHHAVVGEPYAVFLNKHGISFRGKKIDIDASAGVPELEFVDGQTSNVDHARYAEMVEDYLVKGVPKPSELYALLSKASHNISESDRVIRELSAGLAVVVKSLTPPREDVGGGDFETPYYVG